MGKRIGIDFGRHLVKVSVLGKGVMLREVPAVAVQNGQVIAVGNDVVEMEKELGIAEYRKQGIQTVCPLNALAVGDEGSERYFAEFTKKLVLRAIGKVAILRPVIAITFKEDETVSIREKTMELTRYSGAKAIHFVQNASANLFGFGAEIAADKEYLVIDIGYQYTEAAYINGDTNAAHLFEFGGKSLDDIVKGWIRRKYNLPVSDAVAEDIKLRILVRGEKEGKDEIFVDLGGNTMKLISVSEIRKEFYKAYKDVVSDIKKFYDSLGSCPGDKQPALFLAGEGARIPELLKMLEKEFSFLPTVLKRPADTTALGIVKMLESNGM